MANSLTTTRQLLKGIFGQEAFIAFCYDSFPPVYRQFTAAMGRFIKIEFLLGYCEKHHQLHELLALTKKINPQTYQKIIALASSDSPSKEDYSEPRITRINRSNPKTRLELTLPINLSGVTPERQRSAVAAAVGAVAGVLGLSVDEIDIVQVQIGSIVLQIDIPPEAANYLLGLAQTNDPLLHELGIQQVKIVPEPFSEAFTPVPEGQSKSQPATTNRSLMLKAVSILEQIMVHLPEIKQALGKRWSGFAEQIQRQATSFRDLADEGALMQGANQLLALFVIDEAIVEVMTRPVSPEIRQLRLPLNVRRYLDRYEPADKIELKTVANRFYLLCENPDQAAEPSQPDAQARDATP